MQQEGCILIVGTCWVRSIASTGITLASISFVQGSDDTLAWASLLPASLDVGMILTELSVSRALPEAVSSPYVYVPSIMHEILLEAWL